MAHAALSKGFRFSLSGGRPFQGRKFETRRFAGKLATPGFEFPTREKLFFFARLCYYCMK
jgi:hypothetical protein